MDEDEIRKAKRQLGVKIRDDQTDRSQLGIPLGDPRRVMGSQQPLRSELMPQPKKPKPKG